MRTLEEITEAAIAGIPATVEEALALDGACSTDELADAADRVRRRHNGDEVDSCSIVNARSGRCPEDCKWCAQSRRHSTGVEEYDIIARSEAERAARLNREAGIRRFSLVTSGRRVGPADIGRFCDIYRALAPSGLSLCASMGLLRREELAALRRAGVKRYHCNLETSPEFFPRLCTTHTYADKLRTIVDARAEGMEVCVGGIIGMGESMTDRLRLAEEARDAGAVSMPVNILNPIPGTPLEATPLIDEDTIVRSVALMKLVAPRLALRFAGGRARLSEASQLRMLRGGISGALMGDMLTTIGNTVDSDHRLFRIARSE